jgi:hypothetical protein
MHTSRMIDDVPNSLHFNAREKGTLVRRQPLYLRHDLQYLFSLGFVSVGTVHPCTLLGASCSSTRLCAPTVNGIGMAMPVLPL